MCMGVTGPGHTECAGGSQAQDAQDVYGDHRPRTHRMCMGVTGPGHIECAGGSQAQDTQSVQGGGGGAGQDAQDVEGGSQTQDTQSVQRGHVGREGSQGGQKGNRRGGGQKGNRRWQSAKKRKEKGNSKVVALLGSEGVPN